MSLATVKPNADIVRQFKGVRVLVVGDLLVDEFVVGVISRVSREAPVLILKHRTTRTVPGGAGNVARNLAALGANVILAGVAGTDQTSDLMVDCLNTEGIAIEAIVRIYGFVNVKKTRICAEMNHGFTQQVARVDSETDYEFDSRSINELVLRARKCIGACDAILISDYGYGAAAPQLVWRILDGHHGKLPVILDSRYRLLSFAGMGITAATPSEAEVEKALALDFNGDIELANREATKLLETMKLQSIVVTRGRDGMLVIDKKGNRADIPAFGNCQAVDVTGAGDTVIAAFTAALATGANPITAANLANHAAAIAVSKRGTAIVTLQELLAVVDRPSSNSPLDSASHYSIPVESPPSPLTVRGTQGHTLAKVADPR
jgi:D-glycero-beta-D-manno-heptose-7-phosphate kinase